MKKRKNQKYCSQKHQWTHYNRSRAEKNKPAMDCWRLIMKNRDVLARLFEAQTSDTVLHAPQALKALGYDFAYYTHKVKDPNDHKNIFRVCEYGIKNIDKHIKILKDEEL